jgi:hypothetical protein
MKQREIAEYSCAREIQYEGEECHSRHSSPMTVVTITGFDRWSMSAIFSPMERLVSGSPTMWPSAPSFHVA